MDARRLVGAQRRRPRPDRCGDRAHRRGCCASSSSRTPSTPTGFYLNEAYADEAAFDAHCEGPYFKQFFDIIGGFAKGPVWLMKGTQIEDPIQRTPAKTG